MKHPLIPILIALISGMWIESSVGIVARLLTTAAQNMRLPVGILAIYLLLFLLWTTLYHRRYLKLATIMLIALTMMIGMTRYAQHRHLPQYHIAHFITDEVVTVGGVLYRPVESDGDIWYNNAAPNKYLYVNVNWFEHEGIRYTGSGKIRITLVDTGLLRSERKSFDYGDVIKTRLRLRTPKIFEDFDYREYLRRQGIYLIGTLKHDRYIVKLPGWQGNNFLARIYDIRQRIQDFLIGYTSTYDTRTAMSIKVLQAMTLGTSRELSSETKDIFRNSGLYHVLVVSGIHVGIVAGALHYLLQLFGVPRRYRIIGVLPALLLYAGLSGFQFPVLRAVIMAAVLYFSITFNRVTDALYSLCFAAMVLIMIFPDAMFGVSFQMTVVATAAILGLYRCCIRAAWWNRLQQSARIIKIPLISIFITSSAMLGIAPLMLYYFQQLSPYSFISNIAAFVFITPLLPFTLAMELLSLVLPWNVLYPIFWLNVWLGQCLIWVAILFPPLPLTFPRPHLSLVWIYYVGLFGGMMLFLHRSARRADPPLR